MARMLMMKKAMNGGGRAKSDVTLYHPHQRTPDLLVTIGTGVSILRVDGPRQHVRVSGSTIGGGTYWGLMRLLTDIDDFQSVLKLAEKR
jgi:type II pantothenate kinase